MYGMKCFARFPRNKKVLHDKLSGLKIIFHYRLCHFFPLSFSLTLPARSLSAFPLPSRGRLVSGNSQSKILMFPSPGMFLLWLNNYLPREGKPCRPNHRRIQNPFSTQGVFHNIACVPLSVKIFLLTNIWLPHHNHPVPC